MTRRKTGKITALAAAFMLAAGIVSVAPPAQAAPAQQEAQENWTPEKVRVAMNGMKDLGYHDLSDAMHTLRNAIAKDETLSRAAIEMLPELLMTAKDNSIWNEAHFMLDSFMKTKPGVYEADIDRAFANFLTGYAKDTIGITGDELEGRLYHIAIVSKTPTLKKLQIENLALLLPQGDYGTWLSVIHTYDNINERFPGQHASEIDAVLTPYLAELQALLPDRKTRPLATYLIGDIGVASAGLSMNALQSLLPYIEDTDPQVQKFITGKLYEIGNRHPHTADSAFRALVVLVPRADMLDHDTVYNMAFGIYYLSRNNVQRAEIAINLLQQISALRPQSDAVDYIGHIGRAHPQLAPQVVDILARYMAYDISINDAAYDLFFIAEKDKQYAQAAATAYADYLASHPDNGDVASLLARLASENDNVAGDALAVFKDLALRQSPVFRDEGLLDSIVGIGIVNKNRLPGVMEVLETAAAILVENKDWHTLSRLAEALDDAQNMLERHRQSNPAQPGSPPPQP